VDCCFAVSDIAGRQRLRSAHRRQLDVPRHQRSTLDHRTFSVVGPIIWNTLPDELRDNIEDSCFRQSLKTLLFSQYSALEVHLYTTIALYKATFYLLTYLHLKVINRWNALEQSAMDAPSISAFKNSLEKVRNNRKRFFVD